PAGVRAARERGRDTRGGVGCRATAARRGAAPAPPSRAPVLCRPRGGLHDRSGARAHDRAAAAAGGAAAAGQRRGGEALHAAAREARDDRGAHPAADGRDGRALRRAGHDTETELRPLVRLATRADATELAALRYEFRAGLLPAVEP